ncbi:hypothetical protein [Streptomyces sp. DSM 40750]|uniref:hypothetical protein n=1 Tax=Streptomyces sp. DSM 40750 TaxID=2801030 RepID=UPI00214B08F9|nr:hypothetical protein [Streptomyces sp. DSM 40750]UUU21342.1 hypothetical protein JIX55_14030 [Streptomyces sp. DSM 40750]
MAKNKKQDRKQPQSERGQQETQQSSLGSQTEQGASHATPGDMARKSRQKRFGHN